MTYSFARTLRRGLVAYAGHVVSFTVLAVLVYVPVIVLVALLLTRVIDDSRAAILGTTVLTLLVAQVVTAVLFHATTDALRSRPVSVWRSARVVLPRVTVVLGVGISSAVLVVLGSLLLVVPGLIAMTMVWVATPVAVLERRGVVDSLSRSWELVTGNGLKVFATIVIFWVIENLPELILRSRLEAHQVSFAIYFVVPLVVGLVVAPASACVTAAGYHELRIAKEGGELDEIAAAFD